MQINQLQKIGHIKQVIAGFVSLILGRRATVVWADRADITADGNVVLPVPRTGDAQEVALLTNLAVHVAGHLEFTDAGYQARLSKPEMALFGLLEDPRIEKIQRSRFPGAALILSRGLEATLGQIVNSLDVSTEDGAMKAVQMDIFMKGMQALAPQKVIDQFADLVHAKASTVLTAAQRQDIDCAIGKLGALQTSQETESLAKELLLCLINSPQETAQDDTQTNESLDSTANDSSQSDAAGADQGQGDQPTSEQSDSETANEASSDADGGDQDSQQQNPDSQTQSEFSQNQPDSDTANEDTSDADTESSNPDADTQSENPSQGDSGGNAAQGQDAQDSTVNDSVQSDAGGNGDGYADDLSEPATQQSALNGDAFGNLQDFDLGKMMEKAHREIYGDADPGSLDQEQEQQTQASQSVIDQLADALKDGDEGDLQKLLDLALQATEDSQKDDSDQSKSLALKPTVLPQAVSSAQVKDIRLEGVQARLVQVLLKELQDKRRRPAKFATAGGQVSAQRFWRLGALGDTKVFKVRKAVHGVEAAAMVLLDRSGSMEEVLSLAAQAALAFSLALQRIGNIKTAVSMFPGYGAYSMPLQRFGESPQRVASQCESLIAVGTTPLGEAMLAEMPILLQQRKLRNLMFVITDDGPDSEEVLNEAMKMAGQQGIEVFGIGIGCSIEQYIPQSVRIDAIGDLPAALEQLFRNQVLTRLAA